jgi:hypothetical protein
MNKQTNFYEIINNILSMRTQQFYQKEEIKPEIEQAINGCDYIYAVIDYLWVGYSNGDQKATDAFKKVFFDDVKVYNPEAFSFFSFYFMNNLKRRGFDRRIDGSDRRTCYSLDYFSGDIIERRTGIERRQRREQRSNWTRITKWVSVPFKADEQNKMLAVSKDNLLLDV